MQKVQGRMSHIDSLRGLAALLVVWAHVSETFLKLSPSVAAKGTGLYDLSHDADFGRIGVVLFFAVSGFVIPNSFSGGITIGTKTFLIRRFFRLFPLFWFSMLLAIVFLYLIPARPIENSRIMANVTMIPEFLGFKPLLGLYWTLAIELVFYGICLALFRLRLNNNAWVLALLSAAFFGVFIFGLAELDRKWLGFVIESRLTYNCSFLGVMFWGAVYRQWYDKKGSCLTGLITVSTFVILIPGISSLLKHFPSGSDITVTTFAITQIVPVALFILGTSLFKVRHRIFSWTGEISYSLYLLHPIVFQSLFSVIKKSQIDWLMSMHLSIYLIASITISCLVAAITFRLVEQPASRLGKALSTKKLHI